MRFAFPSSGSFAHGLPRLVALGALLCGCSDDPAADATAPPEPPKLELLPGHHSVLRTGADVSGYCAARRGARTAVVTLESGRFMLRTSDSPGLEQASFRAGPEVPGYDGSIECSLVTSPTGFATAWVSSVEGVARVQRLSEDGSPEGDAIATGPSSTSRVALASDGDRLYVGRLATGSEGTEVWVDAIDGAEVTSQRVALCEQPTLPALATDGDTAGVFYACRGVDEVELFGAFVGDDAPVSLGTVPAEAGQMALAAASLDGSWLVQWLPPGTEANALPPLLELDPETLEATERTGAERQSAPGEEPWFVELAVSGDRVYRQLGICSFADAEMPGCHIELCSLDVGADTESCTKLEQQGTPGSLLASDAGATFVYSEQAQDFGGDLYSLVLDPSAAIVGTPRPVTAPGPFAPLGIDCAGAWCSVLGREGQSLLAGADVHRYGFWTSEDVSSAASAIDEQFVLEVDGPVLASPLDPANWSAGLAYFDAGGLRVGEFVAAGPLFSQPVADAGEPVALFFEAGAARYRLFERGADGLLASRAVKADGAGPASGLDAPVSQPMCSAGDGYLALDPATRTYSRWSEETGATAGVPLPPIREGSQELWRCLDGALFGLAYNGTGALLYRGVPGAESGSPFETWTFGSPEGDGGLGGGFHAVAGDLADQRAVFFVGRAGGFVEPLVAIVLGKDGAPAVYALDLPEEAFLSAAAAPSLGDPSVLRLAWSELGSRRGTVSTWLLPSAQ